MTIAIQVSVNGDYKVPVIVRYGNNEATVETISGRGLTGPKVLQIPYYHGNNPENIVKVTVGPEQEDNG